MKPRNTEALTAQGHSHLLAKCKLLWQKGVSLDAMMSKVTLW